MRIFCRRASDIQYLADNLTLAIVGKIDPHYLHGFLDTDTCRGTFVECTIEEYPTIAKKIISRHDRDISAQHWIDNLRTLSHDVATQICKIYREIPENSKCWVDDDIFDDLLIDIDTLFITDSTSREIKTFVSKSVKQINDRIRAAVKVDKEKNKKYVTFFDMSNIFYLINMVRQSCIIRRNAVITMNTGDDYKYDNTRSLVFFYEEIGFYYDTKSYDGHPLEGLYKKLDNMKRKTFPKICKAIELTLIKSKLEQALSYDNGLTKRRERLHGIFGLGNFEIGQDTEEDKLINEADCLSYFLECKSFLQTPTREEIEIYKTPMIKDIKFVIQSALHSGFGILPKYLEHGGAVALALKQINPTNMIGGINLSLIEEIDTYLKNNPNVSNVKDLYESLLLAHINKRLEIAHKYYTNLAGNLLGLSPFEDTAAYARRMLKKNKKLSPI